MATTTTQYHAAEKEIPLQPPPYDAPQQQGNTTTTTIVTQPMVVTGTPIMFGPMPMAMTCPHCQAQIVTSTSYEPGTLTWLLCGGIALVGCFYGCCFIPFCIDDVKDCRHTCPNCMNFLGVYRRI